MIEATVSIDRLIAVVRQGGRVRTGVDVYDRSGTLLLAKEVVVDQVKTLEIIRRQGLKSVPLARSGGVFDTSGNKIPIGDAEAPGDLAAVLDPGISRDTPEPVTRDITRRLKEIQVLRREAAEHYAGARACLETAMAQIRQTRGQFDVDAVETRVAGLAAFSRDHDHPFSYLARELFRYDEYLYTHAVNVCALASAVVHRFNDSFSRTIETALWADPAMVPSPAKFSYFFPDELAEISLGFFLFDLGKAMVPQTLLNKPASLTLDERRLIRRHSYEFGREILEKNNISHPILANLVQYHHAPLFSGEKNSYPRDRDFWDIPLYVRICKLADIYDAMISRRSYGEAANQVAAATALFRAYVQKDPLLQFILHAFVSTIGLYPPGSIVYLKNRRMAYVLESRGPIVLVFTDGEQVPLSARPDPFNAGDRSDDFAIDTEKSVKTPREVFHCLPEFIREIAATDRPDRVRLQG